MPGRPPSGAVFTVLLLLSASAALLYPALFLHWGALETKVLVVPLLQLIMFSMGTRVSVADLRQVLIAPRSVALGLGLQYLIMPFTAAALAAAFLLPADVGAGVILVGSVCAGNSSNVMTYFAGGNMALSVSMTTLSTLLAPLTTPTFMWLLAGKVVPVDFAAIAWSIIRIVVVPVTAGVLAERLLRSQKALAERWMARLVIAATCLVNAIITAHSRDALLSIGLALVCVEVLHNFTGYVLGYAGGRLFGLNARDSVTMAMQVGIRNGGLATGLAYDVLKSSNVALASVVFGTVQNVSGALVASFLRKRQERTSP
ncbi:MAG: bile acid:sodium symporter family protein [Bryobacteraceae bacterium]|nr:bile acid:sodium symporter family protein [Bryobacteraceae bacterium]